MSKRRNFNSKPFVVSLPSIMEDEENVSNTNSGTKEKPVFTVSPGSTTRSTPGDVLFQPTEVIPRTFDTIKEGQTLVCMGGTLYSPSSMYLVPSKDFPEKIDTFIRDMGKKYCYLMRKTNRRRWLVPENKIRPGMFVAVYKKDEKDWFRGIVESEISSKTTNSAIRYQIRLVDLGDAHLYPIDRIYYLLRQFCLQPTWAIPCRFALSSYYDKYHDGEEDWGKAMKNGLLNSFFNKRFFATFLRKVLDNQKKPTWEVQLEKFVDPHRHFNTQSTIQKQVLFKYMGNYVDFDGTVTTVHLGPDT